MLLLSGCIGLLALNILVMVLLLSAPAPTGRAGSSTGETRLCINTPPQLTIPCNTTMSQGQAFACQLNGTDADGHGVVYTQLWVSNVTLFNVSEQGAINFTPENEDVGNHTVNFYVTDEVRCANSETSAAYSFTVENVNDPPFLVKNLPDREFSHGSTLSAFFLDEYFSDPDGDALTYGHTLVSGINLSITQSSEVLVQSLGAACTEREVLVLFTATDPLNASAQSNPVTFTLKCTEPSGNANSGSAGGGGGGGGAASACRSQWECDPWKQCMPNDLQRRRCFDLNGCEDEKFLERACVYDGPVPVCDEDWLCTDWEPCLPNGTQLRTCEDLNECGSALALPPLEQKCLYFPTCNDGIRNGNETGVDCGGECPACALVQKPSPIDVEGGLSWWLALLILAILVVSGVLHYYRSEFLQLTAYLGFLIRHRRTKEILLEPIRRQSLLERISAYERVLEKADEAHLAKPGVYDALAELYRMYFHEALGLELEFLPEELEGRVRTLRHETQGVFSALSARLEHLENAPEPSLLFVLETLELLRTGVCLVSNYAPQDIAREMPAIALCDTMTFEEEVRARTILTLRAVQFEDLEQAKSEYERIVKLYDALNEQEKGRMFADVRRLFSLVRLESELAKD